MRTVVSRFHRSAFCGALSVCLALGPLMLAPAARAQETVNIHPADARTGGPRDAALEAARDGNYVAARDLARKAADAGQPLDADQVDYINHQAARQEQEVAEAAKLKSDQAAAAAQAAKIQKRQQADYTRQPEDACWQSKGGGEQMNAAVNHDAADSVGGGGFSTRFKTPEKAKCPN